MNEDLEQQIKELDAHIAAHPEDAEALYQRGSLHWKLGHRAQALSDFNASAAADPAGPGPAAAANALAILNFSTPQNP